MRWMIQILAMLSDIIILVICGFAWHELPVLLALIFTALTFKAWWKTGGFIAWTPSGIRSFFRNARSLGL